MVLALLLVHQENYCSSVWQTWECNSERKKKNFKSNYWCTYKAVCTRFIIISGYILDNGFTICSFGCISWSLTANPWFSLGDQSMNPFDTSYIYFISNFLPLSQVELAYASHYLVWLRAEAWGHSYSSHSHSFSPILFKLLLLWLWKNIILEIRWIYVEN